jgi:tetratricopeptide (TPR) repeat protein
VEVELGLGQHDKALDDFNKSIALRETVENHFMRARAHEAQKNLDKAADDYRRATQLPATTAFEVQAQREARLKVRQLPKKAE